MFLEMLKIFFPAGDEMPAPHDLEKFEFKYDLMRITEVNQNQAQNIRLISRLFCFINFELTGVNVQRNGLTAHVDFDLA